MDYQIDMKDEGGQKVYAVPAPKLELLRRDAAWAHYWLDIPRERIPSSPQKRCSPPPPYRNNRTSAARNQTTWACHPECSEGSAFGMMGKRVR
ncbi:MAG: hypothetical protein ACE5IP_02890 [Terriglobia bacterium]